MSFSLDGYTAEQPLVPGSAVVLGVRPEHVRVDADITGGEVHDAVVDIEEPMGADNLIWLKHAGHTLSVRVGGHRRFLPAPKYAWPSTWRWPRCLTPKVKSGSDETNPHQSHSPKTNISWRRQ